MGAETEGREAEHQQAALPMQCGPSPGPRPSRSGGGSDDRDTHQLDSGAESLAASTSGASGVRTTAKERSRNCCLESIFVAGAGLKTSFVVGYVRHPLRATFCWLR